MKAAASRPKRTKTPHGYELFAYPSIFARQVWHYPLCLGEATCRPGFQHGHPDFDCRHKDDEGYLLHFLLEGELWHRVGRDLHRASQNSAALLALDRAVAYGNDTRKRTHFYWVWFNGKDLPRIFAELNAGSDPIFTGVNRARIVEAFKELIRLIELEPPGYEARSSALLGVLLAELFAVSRARPPLLNVRTHPSAASEPVQTALKYMARFYGTPLSLKELSREIGLSVYHFSHMFRRETGYSPIQYLKHYRIEQAKTLLAAGKIPVTRVAREVGIPNIEHFSKLFRQINGLSPRAYRGKVEAA